jgi:hypothetical protein
VFWLGINVGDLDAMIKLMKIFNKYVQKHVRTCFALIRIFREFLIDSSEWV